MIKQPRTAKAEQRQAQLEQSLLTLLRDMAYPQITVADICRTAAIPRRTFYHYFDSKDAVLKSIIEELIQRCSLQVMFDFHSSYADFKKSLVRNFYYWRGDGRIMMEILLDNHLGGELVSAGLRWLRSERTDLTARSRLSDKQIEIATTAGVACFFSILHYWRNNNYQESPEEMAEYTTWFLAEPLFRN